MIEVNPGATFTYEMTGFPTGLVGTLGVVILNTDGSVQTARSTAGITEDPTGDHGNPKYTATLTAGAAGRFALQGDDGAGVYTDLEDLIVDFESLFPAESFASVADLESRLQITFTDDESIDADALLRITTGLIQDAADGQTIFLVENDTIQMPGRNDEVVILPQQPVVSVSTITLDGEQLTEGRDWYLDDSGAIRRISNTMVYSAALLDTMVSARTAGFGYPFQTLEITYTHGYAQVPELYRTICMEAVVRAWVNPGSVVQQTVGPESTTYAPYSSPPRGLMLTASELKAIRKKKGGRARGLWIGG